MKKTFVTLAATLAIVGAFIFPVVEVSVPAYAQSAGDQILGGAGQAAGTADPDDPKLNIGNVFTKVVNVILYVLGAIAVIMIVIGGIRYTTSGGDSSSTTAAKNTILYAVIGLIVAILAFAIVNFVAKSFGA